MSMLREADFNAALVEAGFTKEDSQDFWQVGFVALPSSSDYVKDFVEHAQANLEGQEVIVGCIHHGIDGLNVDFKHR
ncbi:hypothetical protein [Ralstonia phage RSP15]|uniref:hypothetical protein n=1 Tax=Ralstonia phage RSP15 TaxID=1785960 RepID=UPI00074D4BD8|nr:hypothetical protein BH754_gp234 [Ralstonia phage RSP15]BAU40072.1 hypothetical protein [Ralstonia phage RSP15]